VSLLRKVKVNLDGHTCFTGRCCWPRQHSAPKQVLQDHARLRKALDPEIADLFEREAKVFASEVLFQGEAFSEDAHGQGFGIKVPMKLAKKYGGPNYATFRRYVTTSSHACCVVVLEQPVHTEDDQFFAEVRRVVASKSFERIYDCRGLCSRQSRMIIRLARSCH
jgi:hypothetical protein